MTTPATPAKTEGPTLPVRNIWVSNQLTEDNASATSYAWVDRAEAEDVGNSARGDVYTLLPPHLADEWRRLREVKAKAEKKMDRGWIGGGEFDCVCKSDLVYAWQAACKALAAFEKQNGIGGGA